MKQITAQAVLEKLRTTGLVVITGPPGIGKSRWGREFVRSQNGFVVDVRSLSDIERVHQRILNVLDVRNLEATVSKTRGELPVLIDNLSTALDAGDVAREWSGVNLVVTSVDQPESDWEVGALTIDESRRLFESLAPQSSVPDRLIETLGGNPLAIEVSAYWASILDPAELEAQWSSIIANHTGLQESYQDAWDVLEAGEKRALLACATFESTIDPEALEFIDSEALMEVGRLHDSHWFERPLLLHQTARSFLQTGVDEPALRSRLCTWAVRKTEHLFFQFRETGAWEFFDEFREKWPVIEQVLNCDELTPSQHARLVVCLRTLLRATTSAKYQHHLITDALERQLDPSSPSTVLLKAFAAVYIGDTTDRKAGLARLEALERYADSLSESWQRVSYWNCWGTLLVQDGDDRGFEMLKSSRAEALSSGDIAGVIYQNIGIARLALRAGNIEEAREYAEESVGFASRERMPYYKMVATGWLGAVLECFAEYERARELNKAASEMARGRFPVHRLTHLGNLALALIGLERYEDARECLDKSLELSRQLGHSPMVPLTYTYQAYCDFALERFDEARARVDQALELFAGYHKAGGRTIAQALRIAEARRTGAAIEPWASRIVRNPLRPSQKISAEAVEALIENIPFRATTPVEKIVFGAPVVIGELLMAEKVLLIDGDEFSFKRREAAWNVLVTLAKAQEPVPAWELAERGWPEDVYSEALLSRLYVTIARLRECGLSDAIVSMSEGYWLTGLIEMSDGRSGQDGLL